MKLLEEFWYGNIEPTKYNLARCKEYKKMINQINQSEEKLMATMTDNQKELLSLYTQCIMEFHALTECLLFQNSFKLGARMMVEVMEE